MSVCGEGRFNFATTSKLRGNSVLFVVWAVHLLIIGQHLPRVIRAFQRLPTPSRA